MCSVLGVVCVCVCVVYHTNNNTTTMTHIWLKHIQSCSEFATHDTDLGKSIYTCKFLMEFPIFL